MCSAHSPDFVRRQFEFAAHIRDPRRNPPPAGIEDRRLGIYRELFFNNVEGFLSSSFPVLRRLLDDDAWLALARDFFARHRCRSPLFLEIPREFLDYLDNERGEQPGDPVFLRELAHYEWVELALSVADNEDRDAVDRDGDLSAGRPLLSSLAWPLVYRFPVHRIGPDFQPHSPEASPVYLLVYRDARDEVGFVELNAVSARLFALIGERPDFSGVQLLQQIAAELQHPQPQAVIEGGLDILQRWRQLGVVRGVRPDSR